MELDFETLNSLLEQTKKTKIFPFIIRNGYQNVSERGFESKGTSSYFFSFFQKVFTGNETITATWEDSTQLNVRDATQGTYNYDFSVGKYYEGVVIPSSEAHNTEIENVNGNDSFMSMQTNGDINVLFFRNLELESDHDFDFDEDYLYKLYIMPETNFGNKWLFISSISTSISPENPNLIIYTVTFSSLKDKLEQSGRALEQYVQYAAPGEPYAFPYITADDEVIVSPLRMSEYVNEPIKYLQVELQGASALSSVTVLGRRLYWDSENEKWYTSPSKFLLPYRFVVPQANPLNKTAAPSKNFYVFPDETVETRATKEWLEYIKNQDTALAPQQNMGAFTMSGSWSNGVHASNTLIDSSHHYDYNDKSWRPFSSFDSLPTISTSGNVYCSDTVVYQKTDSLIQILIKNSMANLTQLELPLDMTQTKPYRWSNIPVIGFWTRWFGDRAIKQHTTNIKTNHLCYLIDTNLATMQYNAFTQSSSGSAYGNLQMFAGENAPAGLNPQSANTTLCFELTDKVTFTDSLYYDQTELANGIDTAYLSQITNESGTNLHTDGTVCLLNCTDSVLEPKYTSYGFVIDNVIVQGLHVGKIKVSCYGVEGQTLYGATYSPQFTQTVLSSSMFEQNNIRSWTTNLTLGTWDSNWSSGEITWPLEPQKEFHNYVPISAKDYFSGSQTEGSVIWLKPTGFTSNTDLTNLYRTYDAFNESIAYSQMDGDINTKEEFLAKYGKMAFSLSGTYCNFKLQYWPNNQNVEKKTAFDIKTGTQGDKYIVADLSKISDNKITITQSLVGMNNYDYNPMFKFTQYAANVLGLCRVKSSGTSISDRQEANAGFNDYIVIEMTFNDTSVALKITNTCRISGIGWGTKGNQDTMQGFRQMITEYNKYWNGYELNYQMTIPGIYLLEKEE